MGFARGVADAEQAVARAEADAGSQRPAREPRPFPLGALQGPGHAGDLAPQDRFEDGAGTGPVGHAASLGEAVVADAAGERRHLPVGDHHPAVAAAEGDHRQQVGRQAHAAEVGLEGEEVARAARVATRCALGGQRLPGAVRHDDERGVEHPLVARAVRRPQAAAVGSGAAIDVEQRPGLEDRRPGARGFGDEPGVEKLAAEGAAVRGRCRCRSRAGQELRRNRWQLGDGLGVPLPERHPPQLCPGGRPESVAHAEGVEQRQVARGDALAADLAARKALALDERHPPAGSGEQDRRGGAGRAGAGDDGVEAQVPAHVDAAAARHPSSIAPGRRSAGPGQ
jgi:hypothetical protein